jgi:hypothetical protein
MADIATLGIEVKTTGVEEATAELTKLSGAAARAEAAVDGLEVASQGQPGLRLRRRPVTRSRVRRCR